MKHELFLEMESVFRKPFNLNTRGGLGGLFTADILEGGQAYAGLAAALSPLYQSARSQKDTALEQMINKVLDDHYDLSEVDVHSQRYIELSESAIKCVRELYVMNK